MHVIPIKTRVLQPPQDDLAAVLVESDLSLQNGDVVAISSKVVAIDEGRCAPAQSTDRAALRDTTADISIPRPYWGSPLTVIHHAFIGGAGIDVSNGNEYLIQLPADPFASAQRWQHWLCKQHHIDELGVIITDSHSTPFRYGACGVALGWWGINPLVSHVGTPDIFGRELQVERSNLVDGLAAAANVVMGETNEQQPVVVMRDVPKLTFTNIHTKEQLFSSYEDDTFRVLYERWL